MCSIACLKDLNRAENKETEPHFSMDVQTVDDNDGGDDDNNDDSTHNGGNDDSTNNDGNNDSTSNGSGTGDGSSDPENEEISGSEKNEHSVYTFLGVSGLYFGCTSTFKSDKETLEFIFGTSKTTNQNFTQEEFEELLHTGERKYGSLGAFTSYPERFSDKVEIAYTDKHGRRWCSSRITEKRSGNGIETSVKIDQSDGEFILEDAHKVEIAAETEGYRLKGKFKCTLYEVNGKAKKKIKGDFLGIVAPK